MSPQEAHKKLLQTHKDNPSMGEIVSFHGSRPWWDTPEMRAKKAQRDKELQAKLDAMPRRRRRRGY